MPIANSFSTPRVSHVPPDRVCKLLATFGGADPADLSSLFLAALVCLDAPDLQTRLIVGPANPRRQDILNKRDALELDCEIIVDPQRMPQEMNWSDLAVTAAGSTCWELALLGVPALAIIAAENQVALANGLEHAGGTWSTSGWGHVLTPQSLAREIAALLDDLPRRRQLSQRGQELVDGLGAARICRAMFDATLQLRPVTPRDARLLFDWVNEPRTRAMSFLSQPIEWDQHCNWLEERLRTARRASFGWPAMQDSRWPRFGMISTSSNRRKP